MDFVSVRPFAMQEIALRRLIIDICHSEYFALQ